MKDEEKLPRTIVNIDGELVSILDNALQHKRSQGDKWLKTRAQLIHIWLWEKANEWKASLKKEDLADVTQS